MHWLKDRIATAMEAFTARRTFVVGAIVAVGTLVFNYLPQLSWTGVPVLFDVPALAWAVLAALLAMIYFLFEYAHRNRMILIPKIRPSFDQHEGGVVQTPTKFKDEEGRTIHETTASHVRIKVEALSSLTIRGCSAFLTGIEKRKDGSFIPIQLPYSIPLTNSEIDVPAKVPRTIDFLQSLAHETNLR